MFNRLMKLAAASGAVMALAACAGDGSFPGADLTTSSLQQQKKAPAIDPECVALSAKINELRADGITGRVEKAGTGKSKTVSVYRTSLARMAALDRANGDFQRKCSKVAPPSSAQQAAVKPAAAAPAAKAPVKTIAKSVKPQSTATANKAAATPAKTAASKATTAASDAAKRKVTEAAKEKAAEAAKEKAAETAKAAVEAKATTVAKKAAAEETSGSQGPFGQP